MGRMAAHVAYILQGKNSPAVKRHLIDHNQYCIVVNSDHTMVKGHRKLITKVFRKHTGWPGGLKEIKMKDYLKKDSVRMVQIFFPPSKH